MTFDFMTTAAPASQPVPPPAASAIAAADEQGSAAAFDAALAETLAMIDRQAARDTTGGIDLPMPAEWIFPAFSAPVAEAAAGDIEYSAVDAAPDDEATDATLGDKPMNLAAVPLDVTIMVPADHAIATVPNAHAAAVPNADIAAVKSV